MKKSDYILIIVLGALIIAGVFIRGYFGGFISGSCAATLLFSTVGKVAYTKTQKRMDTVNEAMFHARSLINQADDSEATNK